MGEPSDPRLAAATIAALSGLPGAALAAREWNLQTPVMVFNCRRTLTNWLGNRLLSLFANWALTLIVPVVVSMALSVLETRPSASSVF